MSKREKFYKEVDFNKFCHAYKSSSTCKEKRWLLNAVFRCIKNGFPSSDILSIVDNSKQLCVYIVEENEITACSSSREQKWREKSIIGSEWQVP